MIVTVKNFDLDGELKTINKSEIARYCGAVANDEILPLIEQCLAESRDIPAPRVCFCEVPVSVSETAVKFPFATVKSKDLAKNLGGCKKAVVFCATVGLGIDRLITKYGTVSPVKSLIFEGIGTERIEALCDAFCREFKGARPRFSPGYGDLDIGFQSAIFKVLQCDKKIGVTLNESLLMSPSKSVTAIMGVKE
ncbi:MAG TPA: hypothetical protein DEW35_03680 [Ruminococcaceae bacterium]|nr:hypothetical protein [Oscillospiraceae bacterium]